MNGHQTHGYGLGGTESGLQAIRALNLVIAVLGLCPKPRRIFQEVKEGEISPFGLSTARSSIPSTIAT